MDDESNLHDVDARVRAALMTDAAVSDRVVTRALADGPRRPLRRSPYAVAIAAALTLILGAGGWAWRRAARPPAASPSLAITGHGSILVVDSQDGRRWIVGPAPERRRGGNYVIVVPQ
jgi:hypothetical protein